MGAVDIQSQEEPSARTVSAVLDAAAEQIAAAGVENARGDAEMLVADALGVKPEQLSVESAGEVPADAAAKIDANVQRRVDREPIAYILGRAASAASRSPSTSACSGRAARPSCWSRSASSCPRARACTRSAPVRARSPWPCSPSAGPAGDRVGPLAGSGRSGARERRAPRPRPRGQRRHRPPGRGRSRSRRPGHRQPSLRHRLDDLRALARDPERAADRRHGILRRGRPRGDPRR